LASSSDPRTLRNKAICCSVNKNISNRRTVHPALSPRLQVTNAPVIHDPVHSQVHNNRPRAVSSIPPRACKGSRHRRLDLLERRQSDAVRVKRSKPNVTRSTTRIVSSHRLNLSPNGRIRETRQCRSDAANVKRSSTNVDMKTNPRCLFMKPQDQGVSLRSPDDSER
jgi:hypothetical protein